MATTTTTTTTTGEDQTQQLLSTILSVASAMAGVFPVGASVEDAIKLAVTIGNGLVNAVPAIEALYQNIIDAANGVAAPTQAQWDSYNQAADEAHAAFLAAVAGAGKGS